MTNGKRTLATRNRVRLALGVAGVATAVALIGAGAPALAAPAGPASVPVKPHAITPNNLLGVRTTQNGVNMRACASTSCAVIGTANASNALDSWCFVSGQSISGNPFWDIIYNNATGRAGFITESLLNSGAQASVC